MKNKLFKGLMFSLMMGVLFCGTTSYAKTASDEIAMGVYVEELNVSGMTKDEAKTAIDAYVEGKSEEKITLSVGDQELEVSRGDLGVAWTNEDVVDEALRLGKSGNLIRRYKAMKDLQFNNKVYELDYTADEELIQTVVTEKCTKYNQKAVNVGLKKTSSGFEVIDGKQGIVVDEENAMKVILNFIEADYSSENTKVAVPTMISEPLGSAEELAKVKDLLGSFQTSFKSSNADRSKNVRTGTGHIDGTVLYPGETFSTYEYVNPFTLENGYAMAGSYLNGKVVDSLGGGICQVSSTLYNAVLEANLDIVERKNHRYAVTYVPNGRDATVSYGSIDFKFKNTRKYPIKLVASAKNGICSISVKGIKEDVEYNVTVTTKKLQTTPFETKYINDNTLAKGTQVVKQHGYYGYKYETYKVLSLNGSVVSSTLLSSYFEV